MYVYTTTNPCICTQPQNNDPIQVEDCNCIKLCHITVNANSEDAVGPCGLEGSIDVSDSKYGHDLCACGESTQYWSVEHFDSEIFVTATVNQNTGVLTWITQGPDALDKQYGSITMKFTCGNLSAYFIVVVGIKDLCQGVVCGSGEVCDDCTGTCEEAEINLNITQEETITNTNINVTSGL